MFHIVISYFKQISFFIIIKEYRPAECFHINFLKVICFREHIFKITMNKFHVIFTNFVTFKLFISLIGLKSFTNNHRNS